jgi:CHAD domain-containing protein
MLADLDSRRYELFVGRFSRLLRTAHGRRSGPPSLPALAVAPDLIKDRFQVFHTAAESIAADSPAGDYHRVRIQCKRLRYVLEFLSELYPERTKRVTKRLVALQDILGLHQDAHVAIDRLRQLAVERSAELPPEAIFDGRDRRALPWAGSEAPRPVPAGIRPCDRKNVERVRKGDRVRASCPGWLCSLSFDGTK